MMMHAFIPGETEAGRSLHSRFQTSQGYVVRLCLQKGKRFRGKKVPTERSLIFKSQNFGVEKKLRTVFFFFNLDNNQKAVWIFGMFVCWLLFVTGSLYIDIHSHGYSGVHSV